MGEKKKGNERWLSIPEVARRLKMSYARTRDRVFKGELGKTKREGRFWFVTSSGVSAYLRRQRAKRRREQRRKKGGR